MFTAKQLTTASLAVLALGSSAVLIEFSGSTAANAQPAAPISASPYVADIPNPLDPPGCWGGADGIWYPDCWGGPGQWGGPGMMGPGQWGDLGWGAGHDGGPPGQWNPAQWGGPGMMGPGQWGGPGMMGPPTLGTINRRWPLSSIPGIGRRGAPPFFSSRVHVPQAFCRTCEPMQRRLR